MMDTAKTITFSIHQEISMILLNLVFEREYRVEASYRYSAESGKYRDIGNVLYKSIDNQTTSQTLITEFENTLLRIDHYQDETLNVEIFGHSEDAVNEAHKALLKAIPQAEDNLDEDIRVKFWYLSNNGPTNVTRKIAVPSWDSVKHNYAESTREGLEDLMNNFHPDGGGKIILWHGLPGTGKTYALRALTRQWKSWTSAEYILDPEALFGQSAGYLTQMIFSQNAVQYDEFGDPIYDKNDEKWKLLILEDTGELLSEDAKNRTGQGLSRLLNLADGFIGQGLRVLVLITTNEELDKLHPAVSRQGRCAAAIHFAELSNADARAWAKRNEIDLLPNRNSPWTLADLYALKTEGKIEVAKRDNREAVGFKIPVGG